jgi:hypothetical protein
MDLNPKEQADGADLQTKDRSGRRNDLEDDTDDGRGVYPAVRAGGTSLFRRGASGSLAPAHVHE